MLLRFAPFAVAVVLIALGASGAARAGERGGAVAAPCGVYAPAILMLTADGPNTYAAYLARVSGPSGRVTGALRVSASGISYRVPVSAVRAFGEIPRAHDADPVVFRLPTGTRIESVFVEQAGVDGETPRACTIEQPWTRQSNTAVNAAIGAALHDEVPAGTPITAIALDDNAPCHAADIDATTRFAQAPPSPVVAKSRETVEIIISLDRASDVTSARVFRTTYADERFEKAALDAATASVFVTSFHACRPTPARYVFAVEFNPGTWR